MPPCSFSNCSAYTANVFFIISQPLQPASGTCGKLKTLYKDSKAYILTGYIDYCAYGISVLYIICIFLVSLGYALQSFIYF